MKTLKIILKISAIFFSVFMLAFLLFAAWFYVSAKDVVFDERKLFSPALTCEIFYADGEKIEENKTRDYAPIDNIPEITRNAFISVEDKRFYTHNGIDPKALLRATINNLFSMKIKEGGSTISQQLVKNSFLSGEKKLSRKFKEIKLTLELEKRYSKDKILEIYLNTIYFGKGVYGIKNAAKRYFGKDVKELNAAESATLAAIVKSPVKYNPVDNPQNSKLRQELVLSLMREQNFISDAEYENYKIQDVIVNFKRDYDTRNIETDEIKNEACRKLGFEKVEQLAGYKIYTSLKKTQTEIIPSPYDYGINCDYTAIIVDNEKKSIIGFSSSAGDLKRCPASAAKPWLVYAPAIEEKLITEATKINDEKIEFGNYSPQNADGKFHGYVSAKEALSKSYNIPSLKIADGIGIEKIKEYAKKMNIEFSNDDLSVSLGNLSGGITLRELASCYSAFTNDGKYTEYSSIEKIVNGKGNTVYENKRKEITTFSDSTAFLINDMLRETTISGTAKKLSSFPFEICAKTGTNGDKSGNTDAYCVAYTTKHTVAIWLGNSNGRTMINSVSGGNYPTAMIKDIFTELYKNDSPANFTIPDSVVKKYIDKKEYNENQKILLRNANDKDCLSFFFAKDNQPTEYAEENKITPVIKDYKITCNNKEISISVTTDDGVGFYLLDENQKEISRLEKSGECKYKAKESGKTYTFYLVPFLVGSDGKEILGEKIKLPQVKTDEPKKTIADSPWWED